jgi:hypothetical protein
MATTIFETVFVPFDQNATIVRSKFCDNLDLVHFANVFDILERHH